MTTEESPELLPPRWVRDMNRFLPLRSQFVLWGNVRDRFPLIDPAGGLMPLPLSEYLAANFFDQGVPHALSFVAGEGLRIVRRAGIVLAGEVEFYKQRLDLNFGSQDALAMSSDAFLDLLERLAYHTEEPVAVMVDFASRMVVRPDQLSDSEHGRFFKNLVLSQRSRPLQGAGAEPAPRFNTIVWLADQETDLPDWLVLGNPRVRSIPVPEPDPEQRRAIAKVLCRSMPGYAEAGGERVRELRDEFVDATDGLCFEDMLGIVQLCRAEGLDFGELGEGARRYKLGVTEDPWKRIERRRIRDGDIEVRKRILGQERAIVGMLDIVKRAVMGLAGGGKRSRRPRGVAFLAGPTGTGKTELAKAVTELLFGDEQAYIRFDMSEFSAEHSDQRLLGAPPGYVGHDAGGELTNAIRERPFSVVLFDEIEKAHPRILDKFLQVLDDGVLTSGRGERVYFSEAFIIFTSNLGIYGQDANGERRVTVKPDDSYEQLSTKVRAGIENYFKLELGRPEILNRLGESFLIFDFIRPGVAVEIFGGMVNRVLADMGESCGIAIGMAGAARTELERLCTEDLSNGGRGISNQIEAKLVNPLARALFDEGIAAGAQVEVVGVEAPADGAPKVSLRAC